MGNRFPLTRARSHGAGRQRHSLRRLVFSLPLVVGIAMASADDCFAQAAASNRTDGTTYKRGRIYLQDDSRLEARDVVLSADSVRYLASRRGQLTSQPLSKVSVVRAVVGNRARDYALFGAGVGAVSMLFAVLQVESNPNADELKDQLDYPVLVLGFAGAGALIGGVVGATQPRWKTVYTGGQERTALRPKYRVSLLLDARRAGGQLSITF